MTAPSTGSALSLPPGRGLPSVASVAGEAGVGVIVLAALLLASVHVFASRLAFLDTVPRSRVLSLGSGVSVAYVFVHVLPEVQAAQRTIEHGGSLLTAIEHHVYVVALFGFAAFYGIERYVAVSRRSEPDDEPDGVFWVHVASFASYNAIIGYLLVYRETAGLWSLPLFVFAIGLHFFVTDHGFRQHHRRPYHRIGRWILASAVVAGTAVGLVVEIPESVIAVLFSFLAGGIILNVIKEELPEERESRFSAFAVGAILYAALLLVV